MSRSTLLFFAAFATACSNDAPVAPRGAQAAQLVLTASASGPLSSLGDSVTLAPRVLDRAGNVIPGVRLDWALSVPDVLTRDAEGVYRAVGNGRVTVVASVAVGETGVRPAGYWAEPVADSVVLEVRQVASGIAILPVDTLFNTIGGRRAIRAVVSDARGNTMIDQAPAITWATADPRIVTVDSAASVRSRGEGSAVVSAIAGTMRASIRFTVNPRLPHTSCMVYAQRKQSRQSCVTLDFVVHERGATP